MLATLNGCVSYKPKIETGNGDLCLGSFYTGISGFSIGATVAAKHCQMLKEIELLEDFGFHDAAVRRMCQKKSLRKALGEDCSNYSQ